MSSSFLALLLDSGGKRHCSLYAGSVTAVLFTSSLYVSQLYYFLKQWLYNDIHPLVTYKGNKNNVYETCI